MLKLIKLNEAIELAKNEARGALQLLWDNVNKGQKKQIIKNPEVKEMFDRFGVDYSDI